MRRAVVMFAIASCGRVGFDPTSPAGDGKPGDGAHVCGAWNAPAPLIFANTIANDWEPTVAPNGGPIVFASDRNGPNELFITPQAPTGPADVVPIVNLNDGVNQWGPAWNADGTRLYFERDNGSGSTLYVTTFDGHSFGPPSIEQGFATSDIVLGAAISKDETELFYGDNGMSNLSQLQRATRGAIGEAWTKGGLIPELDTTMGNGYPTLTDDGNTIIWEADRVATSGENGRWLTATRPARDASFGATMLFTDVPHATGADGDPDLSSHDTVFAFSSTRPGGNGGGNDIWLTTRVCN